jgi:DNA (cytosine-5)-methyltransferase 1
VEQLNIFSYTLPQYKITKPIRIVENFAGIGSQAKAFKNILFSSDPRMVQFRLAMKRLGIDSIFEHYKVVEFDKYAIASYNAIHGTNFEPLDITKITAKDLNIVNTDKYEYIMTYSFPCQDLSIAGKGAGMKKGSGTRSGLLWEVERLLDECKELPQILLMENVPQIISKRNIADFQDWQYKLEQLGYSNYVSLLNAKDYGIPQNRNRCFMVSILGKYYYKFPHKQELKLRLKDMLEDEVDEKYYLSETAIQYMFNTNYQQNKFKTRVQGEIASTLTAITTSFMPSIAIPEATKKGYALAKEGDGIYINRPHQKRGTVQKGTIQTIKSSVNDLGVVVDTAEGLRIRKLTPKECWRLMGFNDEDFEKASKVNSNTQLYKQAGNSIVVNVLMAIFKELL